jgi:hypothetical protein
MDTKTEILYRVNEQAFLEQIYQITGEMDGDIYLINREAFPFALTPASLTSISLINGHAITDLSGTAAKKDNANYDLGSDVASYLSSLGEEAVDLIEYLLNAQVERGEHKWDSLGSFLDWLTLGIVSGTWRGWVSNFDKMIEEPNLYNIVNCVTLGALDVISGAIFPEKPWSLEHWLNIFGSVLIVYSAYRVAANVNEILTGSGRGSLNTVGVLADDADNIVQNAGLTQAQIDDIEGSASRSEYISLTGVH